MIQSLKELLFRPSYWLAAAIVILCIGLQYAGLDDTLRYLREAIGNGQWWLLLSGNFVHLGPSHLWMNSAGLILVVALVWQHFGAMEWTIITVFSSLAVGIGLYLFDPEVFAYVGFSGTLHGLIIAGAIADLRTYPKSAALLLALVAAKLAWEQVFGPLPGSESVAGGSVVVNAHLYGAIAGALLAPTLLMIRTRR